MNILEFITNNLSHVLPILICAAIAIAIVIERSQALFFSYPVARFSEFFRTLSTLVSSGKIQDAVKQCDDYPNKPASKIIKAGLQRAHLPEAVIEDGLQIAVAECSQAISKRTSFLATIANVATLLGLFGTIAGLIQSFEAVAHADAQQKSALLSAGIATAMNATMLGLAVSIPCMVAYSFLTNRANRLISDLEITSTRVMDLLKQRFYANDDFQSHSESSSESRSGDGRKERTNV